MEELGNYVVERLKDYRKMIQENNRDLQQELEYLQYKENQINDDVTHIREELTEKGWTEKSISSYILEYYDASENELDPTREQIGRFKRTLEHHKNDYEVFKYYAFHELGLNEDEI